MVGILKRIYLDQRKHKLYKKNVDYYFQKLDQRDKTLNKHKNIETQIVNIYRGEQN